MLPTLLESIGINHPLGTQIFFLFRSVPSLLGAHPPCSAQIFFLFRSALDLRFPPYRTAAQRRAIREAYHQTYNKDLLKAPDDEISGDFEPPHLHPPPPPSLPPQPPSSLIATPPPPTLAGFFAINAMDFGAPMGGLGFSPTAAGMEYGHMPYYTAMFMRPSTADEEDNKDRNNNNN